MKNSIFYVTFIFLIILTNASSACGWADSTIIGKHGGFTFYKGLIVQTDEKTGKTLTANQAVSVRNLAECAQVCLNDGGCQGVSHRPTSSGQCLTFAGYDFETGHNMSLYLHKLQGIKYRSAIIRQQYQGSVCR
jgi:hypothetical protein